MFINKNTNEIGLLISNDAAEQHPQLISLMLVNGDLIETSMFCWEKII